MVVSVVAREDAGWVRGRRTRLDGGGGLVTESGDGLASLLGGGLGGVGLDCEVVRYTVRWEGEVGEAYPSRWPGRRVPCEVRQTCWLLWVVVWLEGGWSVVS